jgi:hypothetical protein
MVLFKILIAILSACILVCTGVFIYRKILRLPRFWRNTGMLIFYVYTCHYFGVKWMTISLLYLSVCVVIFILRLLSPSSKIKTGDYKTSYSSLSEGSDFSYNKLKGYSNASPHLNPNQDGHHGEERQSDLPKLSRLFLCAFVPLWLIGFLVEAFNNSFCDSNSVSSFTFIVKSNITVFFKNIKAAY